jgi:hypothetical protein
MTRNLRQRISVREARHPVPDPLSNKGFQSSRVVQVACQIVGGAMTPHGANRPGAGGTITAISRRRARGASEGGPTRGNSLVAVLVAQVLANAVGRRPGAFDTNYARRFADTAGFRRSLYGLPYSRSKAPEA